MAQKEAPIMTRSGVTVEDLRQLKDALWSPATLDYSKAELQANLVPLAEQHVSPDGLKAMWKVLYDVSSVDLSKGVARVKTMELVRNFTDPTLVKSLYDTLSKTTLSKSDRQQYTVLFAAAGCDTDALVKTLSATRDINKAGADGVRSYLTGLPRRVAKDGESYDAKGFQDYYPGNWMAEWLAAPQEKRVAPDGKEYTASEFHEYFGQSWEAQFNKAAVATQQRIAEDGTTYSLQEFSSYYKGSWQEKWNRAPVVACKECKSEILLVV
jgi:hypothetical protein